MLKKPNILVVGSFMMDLVVSAPRVPNMGETVIGTGFQTAPGGKGSNQAVQCARLGANVTMVGCVGNDAFGEQLLQEQIKAGVNVEYVKRSEYQPTGIANIQLQENDAGTENRILCVPGANYELAPKDISWLEEKIRNYDMLLLQLEIDVETSKQAAFYAHRAGVPVMLNPAPAAELDKEFLSYVSYLSPNEHEAAILCGRSCEIETIEETARMLQAKGVDNVIVTLGSKGSAFVSREGHLMYGKCVKVPRVMDPTAAGDSFVAAFCTAVSSGMSVQHAMDFASHTAALTVSRMGAMPSLPTIQEVQNFMKKQNYAGFDAEELNYLK